MPEGVWNPTPGFVVARRNHFPSCPYSERMKLTPSTSTAQIGVAILRPSRVVVTMRTTSVTRRNSVRSSSVAMLQ